jgi:putative zinc finger protein
MTRDACAGHDSQTLLAYWLGELDAAAEARLDEHLLACADCSARLGALVDLGAAVRRELLRGTFAAVLSAPFVRRLQAAGVRVREYSVEPGGSVDCTITDDDDLIVSHLHAALGGVPRVDFELTDPAAGLRQRCNNVAFDPAANRIAVLSNAAYVRTLGHARLRMRLLAVDGGEERVLADYTFNHSPS